MKLAYSARNRSASIRIPYVSNPKGAPHRDAPSRIRWPTRTWRFSALMMAGLDGVQNKIHPGDPADKNPYDLPPPEEDAKIPTVCASLEEALAALDKDREFLTRGGVFSNDMLDAYYRTEDGRKYASAHDHASGRIRHVPQPVIPGGCAAAGLAARPPAPSRLPPMTNVDAFDLLATSVFLLNERGHIEYANAAAEDLFGRSQAVARPVGRDVVRQSQRPAIGHRQRGRRAKFVDVRQRWPSLRRVIESVEVTVTMVSLSGQARLVLIETRGEIEQRVWPIATSGWSTKSTVSRIAAHPHTRSRTPGSRGGRPSCWKPSAQRGPGRIYPGHHHRGRPLQALVDRLRGPQRVRWPRGR